MYLWTKRGEDLESHFKRSNWDRVSLGTSAWGLTDTKHASCHWASDPITDGVMPPCSCWESNSGHLEEQPVLFNSWTISPALRAGSYVRLLNSLVSWPRAQGLWLCSFKRVRQGDCRFKACLGYRGVLSQPGQPGRGHLKLKCRNRAGSNSGLACLPDMYKAPVQFPAP